MESLDTRLRKRRGWGGGGGEEVIGGKGGKSLPYPSPKAYERKSFAADVKQQYIFPAPIVPLLWQLLQDLDDLVLQTER